MPRTPVVQLYARRGPPVDIATLRAAGGRRRRGGCEHPDFRSATRTFPGSVPKATARQGNDFLPSWWESFTAQLDARHPTSSPPSRWMTGQRPRLHHRTRSRPTQSRWTAGRLRWGERSNTDFLQRAYALVASFRTLQSRRQRLRSRSAFRGRRLPWQVGSVHVTRELTCSAGEIPESFYESDCQGRASPLLTAGSGFP